VNRTGPTLRGQPPARVIDETAAHLDRHQSKECFLGVDRPWTVAQQTEIGFMQQSSRLKAVIPPLSPQMRTGDAA
jgi:hypothetical protein